MKDEPSTSAPCLPTEAPPTPTEAAAPSAAPTKNGTKIKGTLTIVDAAAHDYEFRAQRQTGLSTQEVVSQTGASKLYRTRGERQPKMVAHLSCPADSSDPASDLAGQLERLTRPLQKKAHPLLRGRTLIDDATGLRMTHNKKQQVLECVIRFDLNRDKDLQSILIKRLQQISTCLAINKTSLTPQKS